MSHAVDTPVVPVPWGIGASRIAASRLPRARAAAQPAARDQCLVILPIHSIPSLFSRKVLGTARGGGKRVKNRINREQLQLFLGLLLSHVALRATKTINTQIPPRDWPPSQVTKLQPCPPPLWPLASPSASGRPGNRQTSDGLGHGRAVGPCRSLFSFPACSCSCISKNPPSQINRPITSRLFSCSPFLVPQPDSITLHSALPAAAKMSKTVVVLGGAYAGLHVAHALLKKNDKNLKVILVTKVSLSLESLPDQTPGCLISRLMSRETHVLTPPRTRTSTGTWAPSAPSSPASTRTRTSSSPSPMP